MGEIHKRASEYLLSGMARKANQDKVPIIPSKILMKPSMNINPSCLLI